MKRDLHMFGTILYGGVEYEPGMFFFIICGIINENNQPKNEQLICYWKHQFISNNMKLRGYMGWGWMGMDGVNNDNDQPKYAGLTPAQIISGFYQQKLKRSTSQNRSVTSNSWEYHGKRLWEYIICNGT